MMQTFAPTSTKKLPAFSPARPSGSAGAVLQRKCECGQHAAGGECEECKKKKSADPLLRRSARTAHRVSAVPSIVHSVLCSSGQPLDAQTRAYFEPRFGRFFTNTGGRTAKSSNAGLEIESPYSRHEKEAEHYAESITADRGPVPGVPPNSRFDFSHVRIHADAQAAESARSVNAVAYNVGSHVVFGRSQYDPTSAAGRRLLAHELTHVAQQAGGLAPQAIYRQSEITIGNIPDTCENAVEITDEVKAFLKGVPELVQKIPKLNEEAKKGFVERFREVMAPEGGVDLTKFTFWKCSKINLGMGPPGQRYEAYGDLSNKKIGFSTATAAKMDEATQFSDVPEMQKDALEKVLTTIAHEKRHFTLKDSPKVTMADTKHGDSQSTADWETYQAEEVLATAEEIAYGRLAEGTCYRVPLEVAKKFASLPKKGSRKFDKELSILFGTATDFIIRATTSSPWVF